MILSFFDYVYYRTYSAYKNLDNMPYMYAIGLVSLLQQFNVFTIFFWIDTFFGFEIEINKYVAFGSFLVFMIPNYLRYTRFVDFKRLANKWDNEMKKNRTKNGGIVLGYIIFSIIFLIATAQITGMLKRGEL